MLHCIRRWRYRSNPLAPTVTTSLRGGDEEGEKEGVKEWRSEWGTPLLKSRDPHLTNEYCNHNQSILRRFSSQRTQIHRGPCDEKRSIWLRHTATSFITYHLYWELWAQPRQAQLHQNDPSTSQHQSATLITCSNPPSIRSCWRDATTFLPAKLSATAGSGRNTFGWHTTMGHPSASCVTKLAKSGILCYELPN